MRQLRKAACDVLPREIECCLSGTAQNTLREPEAIGARVLAATDLI